MDTDEKVGGKAVPQCEMFFLYGPHPLPRTL